MKLGHKPNSTNGYYADLNISDELDVSTESLVGTFDGDLKLHNLSGKWSEVQALREKDLIFATPRHPYYEIDLRLPGIASTLVGHNPRRCQTASPALSNVGLARSSPSFLSSLDCSSFLSRTLEEKVATACALSLLPSSEVWVNYLQLLDQSGRRRKLYSRTGLLPNLNSRFSSDYQSQRSVCRGDSQNIYTVVQ